MKTYTFHVSLPGTGRVWRKIELQADQTLEDLHFAIQDAYEWDADHLYSFFMSGKAWDRGTEYCLPEGCDPGGVPLYDEEFEEPLVPELDEEQRAQVLQLLHKQLGLPQELVGKFLVNFDKMYAGPGDVRTTTLESLGLKLNQEFMYLFDYGDEWRFKVRVHAINENADPDAEYPCIVESVGEAPEQYPDGDE
ncbi:MAG: plasmid pRiA4b ORF-3 family protein [Chloroflexi bacterium]|nr:plasmid pRiA4b ORF-3 family protein [Chloroflexota bacterium]